METHSLVSTFLHLPYTIMAELSSYIRDHLANKTVILAIFTEEVY